MKKIFFTVIALMLSNTLMFGQEKEQIITLEDKNDLLLIGKSTYFLEDVKGDMTIEDILKPENQDKFTLGDKDVFARSATSSAFWFKITVQNEAEEDAWLEVGSTYAWYIDFYTPDSTGRYGNAYKTGTMRPENPLYYEITNAFWLPLNKAKDRHPRIYYVRITEEMSFEAPLNIGTVRSLYKNNKTNDYLTAGFVGLLIIMVLFNAFLYISTKDFIYVLYIGFLLASIWTMTHMNCYTLFPNVTWFHRYFLSYVSPGPLSLGFFCIRYLELGKNLPMMKKIILFELLIVAGILPILNLAGIKLVDLIAIYQLFIITLTLTCLSVAYYLVFTGHKYARLYVAGWTFCIISVLVYLSVVNGLLPFNPFTRNTMYFGVALEVWMFSLALGDRLNVLRKENKRILEEQNAKLELAVTERTEELQVMNEELNSSVEELSLTLEILDEQKKTIEVINNKITTSIDYAQTIQGVILADDQYLSDCLSDYFLIYRPKDIVSGDFYWLHPLKNGLIVVVADCTGHGVAGSFMSLIGINLLDNMEREMEVLSPAEIISKLNIAVEKALKQGERNSYNEGMDIAVCKITYTKSEKVTIEFSGAKRPLYYSVKHESQMMSLVGDRKSVGSGISPPYEFQNHGITLAKGDMVYLCSDGFEDQNNPERKKFGEKRLKNILSEISRKNVQEQREILTRQLEAHQLSAEQRDDITLMGIRLN